MSHRRADRVADMLKQEISDIIRSEMKDPRIGFITLTKVDLSQDLRHAKVYVSILGTEDEREKSFKVLESANGFIRSQVGRRVRLRHIPELLFRYDDSSIYAARIYEVMKQNEPEFKSENPKSPCDASSLEDEDHG